MNHLARICCLSFAVLTIIPNGNTLFGMKRKFSPPTLTIPKDVSKATQKAAEEAFYAELYGENPTADKLRQLLDDWLDTLNCVTEGVSPSVHYHRDATAGILVFAHTREAAQQMLLNGIVREVLADCDASSEILTRLIALGADTKSALLDAARHNNLRLVNVIISRDPYAVNYQNEMYKTTAFIYAAKHNNYDMLYALDRAFVEVSQLVLAEWEQCPLDVFKFCIQPFFDPMNAQDSRGNTPLMYAAENDDLPMVRYLLQRGADKSIQNNAKQTADQMAITVLMRDFIVEYGNRKNQE
ncbi:MAG: ankyrin repeat domain-containing protein [Candidatus Babeliales bacterium]|jgi:hypothetical protein